ncbi:aldehyde dehydrogenase [Sabulilitoribacter multivorans]|uniref:Aldehyde dehydrogenase n=1 Tax=Flaviramulus multivorans TaxID=1304750 RepID=A0ABS9IJR5_9FLAO|nr:aldehyde dehydrogenase [Flaviramulus multivorans]MCF7560835.1 aldehyde dehydrogenase [Flaviramulus multivorans]
MYNIPKILSDQKAFFESQKTKEVSFRLSLLKKLKSEIISNEKDIMDALYKDFKKSKFETFLSEYALVKSSLSLTIKNLKKWSKPKRIWPSILTFPSSDYIYKEPYGNVLIIAPWNYPFLLALEPLVMAVAAGNTVVLKPSELTSNTSKILTKIISNTFPKEYVKTVEGGVEVSTELLAQKWDYIFFTGSTKVGKIVAEAAAKNLTPITLELGGKSPCIIDDTVDLTLVTKRLVWGKFLNGGQTCIAPDYIIAKSEIKEQLINALKSEIIRSYGENPKKSPDLARIIDKKNTIRLQGLIENETVVFGGDIDENDHYISPTIVDEPKLDSGIMSEEIFGPLLPILTYNAFEDIENIVSYNKNPLSLYVFSNNKRFVKNCIEKFSFGGGVINDLLIQFGNHRLPFGGVGASGMGRYHGKHGFDTFTHHKPIIKRGNWMDPPFRYAPYKGKLGILKKLFKYFG